MDMYIYMGYCIPCMFRTLAFNCHDVSDHFLFKKKIEMLIQDVKITSAIMVGELMSYDLKLHFKGPSSISDA
ncbi:hypothetical protein DsansV1_C23g0175481 [Dioscorea sansibarensis]